MQKPYSSLKREILKTGKIQPNDEARNRVERAKLQEFNFVRNREKAKKLRGFALISELPKPKTRIIEKITRLLNGQSI